MAAIDSLSSCGPQAKAHPPPPMAHAPTPMRVIIMSEFPSRFVSMRDSRSSNPLYQSITLLRPLRCTLDHRTDENGAIPVLWGTERFPARREAAEGVAAHVPR